MLLGRPPLGGMVLILPTFAENLFGLEVCTLRRIKISKEGVMRILGNCFSILNFLPNFRNDPAGRVIP